MKNRYSVSKKSRQSSRKVSEGQNYRFNSANQGKHEKMSPSLIKKLINMIFKQRRTQNKGV